MLATAPRAVLESPAIAARAVAGAGTVAGAEATTSCFAAGVSLAMSKVLSGLFRRPWPDHPNQWTTPHNIKRLAQIANNILRKTVENRKRSVQLSCTFMTTSLANKTRR